MWLKCNERWFWELKVFGTDRNQRKIKIFYFWLICMIGDAESGKKYKNSGKNTNRNADRGLPH
jgi:hypothetical protein